MSFPRFGINIGSLGWKLYNKQLCCICKCGMIRPLSSALLRLC